MTPEQLHLVSTSSARLRGGAVRFTAEFQAHLSERAPGSAARFVSAEHESALVDELMVLVGAAGRLDVFLARARRLGARYQRSGARPADFVVMEAALVSAAADLLGPEWSPDVEAAWSRLFRLIAEAMAEGARSSLFSRDH